MHMPRSFATQIVRRYRALVVLWMAVSAGILLLIAPMATAANISIGGPSDNDNNAVISGGVHSVNAIQQAFNSNDCVREIFGAFGISQSNIANLTNTVVAGRVTKSGEVFINGQTSPVARGAMTGGRQNMSGSTAVRLHNSECKLFRRPPSVSFQQNSLPAFVSMQNHRFQFAIIASCGNAVSATPVIPPHKPVAAPKPAPQPTPTPTPTAPTQSQTQTQNQTQSQMQSQSQQVTVQQPTPAPTPTPTPTPTPVTPTPTVVQTQPVATPAATLPNTGAGDVIGLFTVSSMAGFLGYRWFLARKFGS